MKKPYSFVKLLIVLIGVVLLTYPTHATAQRNKEHDDLFFEVSMHGGYSSLGTVGLMITQEGLFFRQAASPFHKVDYYGFVPMANLDDRKVNALMEYIQWNRIYDVKAFQYPKEWVTSFEERRPVAFTLHRPNDTSLCHFTYQYKHPLIEEMIRLIMDNLPKEVALDSLCFSMPERGLVISEDINDTSAMKSLKPEVLFDDTVCVRKNLEEIGENKLLSIEDFVSVRITATHSNDDQQILLLTLAGLLYETISADGFVQFGFVPYKDGMESIWDILVFANNNYLGFNTDDKNKRINKSSSNINVEIFYHNTLMYRSFHFNRDDIKQRAFLRKMNKMVPKRVRRTYKITSTRK